MTEVCPRCFKKAFQHISIERKNKYGAIYTYFRYAHYDKRKKNKRSYCYYPAPKVLEASENAV